MGETKGEAAEKIQKSLLFSFNMKLCVLTNSISNMTIVFSKFWPKSTQIRHLGKSKAKVPNSLSKEVPVSNY